MDANFHDKLSDYQAEIVSYACDVLKKEPNMVFVLADMARYAPGYTIYYYVKGKICTQAELKPSRKAAEFGHELSMNIHYMTEHFVKNGMEAPVWAKLYYDVRTSEFKAEYHYPEEGVEEKDWLDLADEWHEELKRTYNS